MFKKMLNHKNIKLMLNTNFNEICEVNKNSFKLFGNKFKGKVIYTGEIDELFNYKFGELPYRSIKMEFETLKKKKFQEVTTVNYPNNYDFTRVTEFKNMYITDIKQTTILKEYPQEYIKNKNIPYYPVLAHENRKMYNKYKEFSKNWENLILIGRLAEYKYYDMDDVVKRALDVFDELSV
jgi:UDP-galactopyranose mutase